MALPRLNEHSGGFFVVSVIAPFDLLGYINKNDYSVFAKSYFCDQPENAVMLGMNLYQNGLAVTDQIGASKSGSNPAESLTGRFIYDVVLVDSFDADWEVPSALRSRSGQTTYKKFNLINHPQNVCISVSGGTMLTRYHNYEFNVVRVSKESLVNARSLHR